MAKIDREYLPEWFKLEKYRMCESFRAAEWLEQLRYRQQVLQGNPIYPNKVRKKDVDESAMQFWRKAATTKAAQLRSSPIKRTENGAAMIVRGRKSPLFARHGDLITYGSGEPPIRPITMHGLLTLAQTDKAQCEEGEDKINAKRWEILNYTPPFTLPGEIARSQLELGDGSAPVVSINLKATDSVLIEAFSVWLKNARAAQMDKVRGVNQHYEDWSSYGLLPYLDLLIWSMETNTKIPYRVISYAVGYTKGEGAFSKTVAPLAARLMRDLSGLQALAAVESATQAQSNPEIFED